MEKVALCVVCVIVLLRNVYLLHQIKWSHLRIDSNVYKLTNTGWPMHLYPISVIFNTTRFVTRYMYGSIDAKVSVLGLIFVFF